MNAPVKLHPETSATVDPLAKLREPFAANHISKLPKETKAQIDERKADRKAGIKCELCGGWHHRNAVHLDYVGHAALTDRLLDVDPQWFWEPLAYRDGLPAFDGSGGLWIKLTVCGVTRLGYGHAAAKPQMDPGAREKEVIGDALRNAAMRFGAALDLWHKGDLHAEPEEAVPSLEERAISLLRSVGVDRALLKETWEKNRPGWKQTMEREAYARVINVVSELVEALPKEPIPPPAQADDFGIGDDNVPEFA